MHDEDRGDDLQDTQYNVRGRTHPLVSCKATNSWLPYLDRADCESLCELVWSFGDRLCRKKDNLYYF